jgi:hypothetical protein
MLPYTPVVIQPGKVVVDGGFHVAIGGEFYATNNFPDRFDVQIQRAGDVYRFRMRGEA